MKPTWMMFTKHYPDYVNYPSSTQVKKDIGGKVDLGYITNTCAIRMSRGLNYSGLRLDREFPGLTVTGGDGKLYALRVADMRKWLPRALGVPTLEKIKAAGTAFDKAQLATYKGIIAFDITFSDATGHLDSWDGHTFSDEQPASDYWTRATKITVWALP